MAIRLHEKGIDVERYVRAIFSMAQFPSTYSVIHADDLLSDKAMQLYQYVMTQRARQHRDRFRLPNVLHVLPHQAGGPAK